MNGNISFLLGFIREERRWSARFILLFRLASYAEAVQVGGEYVIFDNKSKYGTTIRDSKTYLKLDMTKKGVQIDRTILMMRIVRKNILE